MGGVFTHRDQYAQGGANILRDPGMESFSPGTTVAAEPLAGMGEPHPTLSIVDTEAHTGEQSLEVVANSSDDEQGVLFGNEETILPGNDYNLRAWVKADADEELRLTARLTSGDVDEPFTATGDWQSVSMTVEAEELTRLAVRTASGNTSGPTFYVDDVQLALTSDFIAPFDATGQHIWFPPEATRLCIKLRAGDSDAEPDRLHDIDGEEPVETIRVFRTPAWSSLPDSLT